MCWKRIRDLGIKRVQNNQVVWFSYLIPSSYSNRRKGDAQHAHLAPKASWIRSKSDLNTKEYCSVFWSTWVWCLIYNSYSSPPERECTMMQRMCPHLKKEELSMRPFGFWIYHGIDDCLGLNYFTHKILFCWCFVTAGIQTPRNL